MSNAQATYNNIVSQAAGIRDQAINAAHRQFDENEERVNSAWSTFRAAPHYCQPIVIASAPPEEPPTYNSHNFAAK